jgi:hypothetical protein
MCTDDVQVWLVLERSEHPDDRRLPRALVDIELAVRVVPREGEYLELPWPLSNDCGVESTTTVRAVVESVEHFWTKGDLIDGGERIPALAIRITAQLMDPDITDGPWE